ncbi:hypothetical protein [Hyphomicrobium sulfonivorans]|uniref:Uncharacterized protein n=1 Tax=Hyphomicrobium sulfonivorans TaxID=121290 RepID=A0A109BMB5_HYPSL|nr:hypothetical protein [Hyphomicrobium sulfonivorans]KWT71296.1 hypothetical protein APY04_0547 [Hyphomicrobium sulfonivorans]
MHSRRTQALEGLTESAVLWFLIGLVMIGTIACVLGLIVPD